jgi:hypothetical protein
VNLVGVRRDPSVEAARQREKAPVMFDLLSLSTIIPLLKIAVGVAIFGGMLLFLFKLLTGRYSFLKNKGGGGKIARAFMPDAEFAEAAFEEVRQS